MGAFFCACLFCDSAQISMMLFNCCQNKNMKKFFLRKSLGIRQTLFANQKKLRNH